LLTSSALFLGVSPVGRWTPGIVFGKVDVFSARQTVEGHSLSMLKRIADALNQRLEIRFVSNSPEPEQVAT
jgi:hypothetical protein